MTRKAKPNRAIWCFGRRLAVPLFAGGLFLAFLGSLVVLVTSVSQRYKSQEDTVTHYLQHFEPQWYNNPQFVVVNSDIEITRRHTVDEVNAIHLDFSWKQERDGVISKCKVALLAQEYPDIFGGWREVGHLEFYCGHRSREDPVKHTFWESQLLEFPHYYYFYAHGSHRKAAQVEAVLADGSSERADIVDKHFALVIRREAPFQIEKLNFLGADGEILHKRKL